MTELPVLYSFRRCPYAMRARMALLISGVSFKIREVALKNKPAEMIAASAKGTVPVLVLPDGTVIEESLDIMHWALSQNDPESWLSGDDPSLIAINDGAFKHHLDRYKYPERHGSNPIEHRDAGMTILAEFEQRLGHQGNLCRDRRALADVAIFPFVRQFAQTDRMRFDAQPLSRLQSWLKSHIVSPLFEQAMIRLEPWQPKDAPTVLRGDDRTVGETARATA